jgi:vacuolar-type H+-ATPase subunit H
MNTRISSDSLRNKQAKEREFVSRESSEYQDFALKNEIANMGLAESFAFSLHANELKVQSLRKGLDGYEELLTRDLPDDVREHVQTICDTEYQKLLDAQNERSEKLSSVQDQLMELMEDAYYEAEIVARMEEIMGSGSSEGEELQRKFGTAQVAVDKAVFGSDMEDLVLFLNAEAKRFQEKREAAFERFREWVNDFFERAHDSECQKYLKRSLDEIRKILRKVNFAVLDGLRKQTHLGHADGSHIAIDLRQLDRDPEGAKHTVFHELAHHVSGVGIVKEPSLSLSEDGQVQQHDQIQLAKLGGHFNRSKGPHSNRHKQMWLNEALTELVASKMSGVPFRRERPDASRVMTGYGEYIDEVWEMVDAGITWDELYDAWAEDMLVEPENGTRIPKYDHLIRRIREVEGRGAMKRHVENIENKTGGMRVNEETGERYYVHPKKLRLDPLP